LLNDLHLSLYIFKTFYLFFIIIGKKSLTFRRVPMQQGRWHRIVIRFNIMETGKPEITLFIDCLEIEKQSLDIPFKETLMEDSIESEIRLNQLLSIPGKDPLKFIVSCSCLFFFEYSAKFAKLITCEKNLINHLRNQILAKEN